MALREHRALETVAQAERLARRRLPRPVYMAIVAGRERGLTRELNVESFDHVAFRPRVGARVSADLALATTFMGQELSLPVVLSPAGVQAVHPHGEIPAARAAATMKTGIGHSQFANSAFEDVAAVSDCAFAQLNWMGSRTEIRARVERMRQAGAKGLIVTLDIVPYQACDWGAPRIPERLSARTAIAHAPMALSRPAWLWAYLRRGRLPTLRVPNLATSAKGTPTLQEAFAQFRNTPFPTWDDIHWLRELWGGPFMVKGIMSPEDASRAADIGATAISVSNHGGNNLDGSPSPLRVLPAIVSEVGDRVEVAYDGGIRRGSDVVKALAMGAQVVLIGRAYLFALAARGETGVQEVLELLRNGMTATLMALGKDNVHGVDRHDLYIPESFELR